MLAVVEDTVLVQWIKPGLEGKEETKPQTNLNKQMCAHACFCC